MGDCSDVVRPVDTKSSTRRVESRVEKPKASITGPNRKRLLRNIGGPHCAKSDVSSDTSRQTKPEVSSDAPSCARDCRGKDGSVWTESSTGERLPGRLAP